ncbi:MAG: DUF4325 domain-containing protein [Peptococcaceae bacterium]|nr:DUF4325 domain-containing protein [Peptococcaceae bacterium]MDH7523846.1 DUF4325 domain-containing protein [Peptococcaceae bacterium]
MDNIYTFSLIKYGEKKLWGREKAKRIREQILDHFMASGRETLNLDLTAIDIVDFSFAAEAFAVLIARLSKELSGKHIVFSNMAPLVRENISIALEKADLCALALESKNTWSLIGKCSEPVTKTLEYVLKLKSADTPTLAGLLNTNVHAVNNRLKVLMSLGLVNRTRITAPSGGKQYIYHSIL